MDVMCPFCWCTSVDSDPRLTGAAGDPIEIVHLHHFEPWATTPRTIPNFFEEKQVSSGNVQNRNPGLDNWKVNQDHPSPFDTKLRYKHESSYPNRLMREGT